MTRAVTYVELNTPDLERSRIFFSRVFGWDPQPFAVDDYLVAPAPEGQGTLRCERAAARLVGRGKDSPSAIPGRPA
jgi:hypothetical protein